MDPRVLTEAFLEKVMEQVERLTHLLALAPAEQLDWRPPVRPSYLSEESSDGPPTPSGFRGSSVPPLCLGDLIGHLLECMAGFCAVLYAANPDVLAHFSALRDLTVNHYCDPHEAIKLIGQYVSSIQEGFGLIDDAALGLNLRTAFVRDGEPIMTLLLGNLEHLINHKYQLFLYLRMMGIPVGTPDMYRFRG